MLTKGQARLSAVPIHPSARKELTSLTYTGLAEALAASVTGNWEIEIIEEPGGDKGLVVMPASGDDRDGPTLILWEHDGAYRVDALRWDTYLTVAHCTTTAEGLAEVRRRMRDETLPYRN
jgi:hypothetical protein